MTIERAPLAWALAGLAAAVALPWYALQDGLGSPGWLAGLWSSEDDAAALAQVLAHGRWWLAPVLLALVAAAAASLLPGPRQRRGTLLLAIAGAGVLLFGAQAFAIGLRGWTADWLAALFGTLDGRQFGLGAGGTVVLIALLSLLSIGLARRGAFGGDAFVAGAVTTVATAILLFTAWPILRILLQAFQDADGNFTAALLGERLGADKIWSLRCLVGAGRCGVAWNTLFLALPWAALTLLLFGFAR
jgi:iron(III) transport system permease protein